MKVEYYDCMTNAMKEVVDFTLDEERLKKEFLFCHEMYMKANKAGHVKLPHETEDGKLVKHGARLVLYGLEDYWEIRRDAIKRFLPREWVEEQGVNSFMFKC